jgi:hypothetical protein
MITALGERTDWALEGPGKGTTHSWWDGEEWEQGDGYCKRLAIQGYMRSDDARKPG